MKSAETLFPLPLTIFEQYMYLDSHPNYPMDSFRRLNINGIINRAAFQSALNLAIERHPLFACKVEKSPRGTLQWVFAEKANEICWKRYSDADVFTQSGFPQAEPLDLSAQPGLKAYVLEDDTEKKTQILFQFHHSASDGTGEMQFLRDLITLYGKETEVIAADVPAPILDSAVLLRRGRLGWTLPRYIWFGLSTAFTTWQILGKRVQTLVPPVRNAPISKNGVRLEYPQIRTLDYSIEQTAQYAKKAKQAGVTVNDLLLADFARAIHLWRQERDVPRISGSLRLSVPMNLRNALHENMPAGNVVTMVFVDTDPSAVNSPDALVQSMHRKMNWIKTRDQKFVLDLFLKAGNFLGRLVGGDLSLFLRSSNARSTACLSNLGRVLETVPLPRNEHRRILLSDAVLDSVDAAPPIRPGTALSLSALTYGSALRFCLRFDDSVITNKDADRILDLAWNDSHC